MSTETTTALKSKRTRQAVVLSNKMDKTGGGELPCVVHRRSLCWRSVGMPQLGNLLVRPSVLNITYFGRNRFINKIHVSIWVSDHIYIYIYIATD